MDSTTSSIVSTLGAGSGVDMVKLAADLSAARFAPQTNQLQARHDALEAKVSAASALRNQLSQLASALGDRMRNGDLAPTASVANSSVANVTVPAGISPQGTYSLEVTQLAKQQMLALQPFPSASDLVGEGTLTLRFGTVSGASFAEDSAQPAIDIAVTATDTLETLASKINSSGGSVTAYIVNGTSGAQLMLKGAEGAASGFTIEGTSANASPTANPGDLSYLSWAPASDAGELRQNAQDAVFKFDTVSMTSATNKVSGLPGGLTMQLKATNIGAPTTISFDDHSSAITAVMGDFVAALNDITKQLKESAAPLGGELGNDPGARALKRALSQLTSEVIMPGAAPGDPSTLADLGVSINRDGTFRLDSARLQATLADHGPAATAMFTVGLHGIYATIDDLSRAMGSSSDPSSLAGSEARYNNQIQSIDDRLAKITEQQDKLRETMTKTFTAADRNVAASQSTLNFIKSQVAIWTAKN